MPKEKGHDAKELAFWDANEQRHHAKELGISVELLREGAYAVSKTKKPSRSVSKIKKWVEEYKAKQEEADQGDVEIS